MEKTYQEIVNKYGVIFAFCHIHLGWNRIDGIQQTQDRGNVICNRCIYEKSKS